jgi:hypothetical protein
MALLADGIDIGRVRDGLSGVIESCISLLDKLCGLRKSHDLVGLDELTHSPLADASKESVKPTVPDQTLGVPYLTKDSPWLELSKEAPFVLTSVNTVAEGFVHKVKVCVHNGVCED